MAVTPLSVTVGAVAVTVNVVESPLAREDADVVMAYVPPTSTPSALAGTTTRLRTNVRANSKERNFFM